VAWQPPTLEVAHRHQKRILLQHLVDRRCLAQVPLTSSFSLRIWNLVRLMQHRAQSVLSLRYFLTKSDPGQRLAGLFEYVVCERPVIIPRLNVEWLTAPREVIEIAALLCLPNLTIDRGFPCSLRARI
jgi:hypothetical protein